MELKDYLHLYLGCEVQYEGIINGKELGEEKRNNKEDFNYIPKIEPVRGIKIGVLKSVETNVTGTKIKSRIGRRGLQTHYGNGNFKLILRPLSDITIDEIQHLADDGLVNYRGETPEEFAALWSAFSGEAFIYLLSKGFDLFGLIDAGLAIDKTKISQTA